LISAEIPFFQGAFAMNPIAAPAHIAADDQPKRIAAFDPRSIITKALKSLIGIVVRSKDDDAAKQYEGSSWCDQTEHDLNYDVMTGRRTRRS
jgi:hypothetical protein